MNWADLKEKIIETFNSLWSRIQESDSFITVSEKYKNLSPNLQKIVIVCAVLLVVYIVYSIPASFVESSQSYEANFKNNRNLIRELFRTARNPVINTEQFRGPDFDEMKTLIDTQLLKAKVLETQKGAFSPINKPLPSQLVPNAIRQTGLTFELKKLNLTQVVQMSQHLSSMHPNTKLAGVEVDADKEDPHYFNVNYTVSSLSLPVKEDKPKPNKRR